MSEPELPLYAKVVIVYAIVATLSIIYLRSLSPNVEIVHKNTNSSIPITEDSNTACVNGVCTITATGPIIGKPLQQLSTTSEGIPNNAQVATVTSTVSATPSFLQRITSIFSSTNTVNVK